MSNNERIDFMQELYRIVLNWLAKQAGSVILLSGAVVALWTVGSDRIEKLEGQVDRQSARIEAQGDEIRKCDMERAALQVEVGALRQRIELMLPLKRLR